MSLQTATRLHVMLNKLLVQVPWASPANLASSRFASLVNQLNFVVTDRVFLSTYLMTVQR
jgi:hypothetical protein